MSGVQRVGHSAYHWETSPWQLSYDPLCFPFSSSLPPQVFGNIGLAGGSAGGGDSLFSVIDVSLGLGHPIDVCGFL